MIEITKEEKILFIEAFSEELIKSSFKRIGLFKIQKLIDDKYGIQKPEERRKLVKKIVESREKEREEERGGFNESLMELSAPLAYQSSLSKSLNPSSRFFASKKLNLKKAPLSVPKTLRIPEPKMPSRLNYLQPIKTNEEVDVGKLNSLVQDPNVMSIEIEGPNKNVFVSGRMGSKKTGVVLTKDEIEKIINNFSVSAKIPLSEGVNKIAHGRLVLNAILSDKLDKRFSLKKISDNTGLAPTQGFVHKRRVF